MRWCDVDLKAGTIDPSQSVTRGANGVQLRAHGNKKEGRTVALSSMATDRLRDHKSRMATL